MWVKDANNPDTLVNTDAYHRIGIKHSANGYYAGTYTGASGSNEGPRLTGYYGTEEEAMDALVYLLAGQGL